jgi:phosphate transport system substrate-binding protein
MAPGTVAARSRAGLLAVLAAGWLAAGLPAHGQPAAQPGRQVVVHGAGATFPAPLYEKWIATFGRQNPDLTITYDGVGSGEGQKRFLANAVDFGASDAALSDEQLASVRPGARLVPVTAGIVVLAYNLPGLGGDLRLSRDVYVDIFAGRIRTWNDPRIRADNPGLALPNRSIATVVRQDGSGTTYALTAHLSAVSPEWRDRGAGTGTLVTWPGNAMRARGNEGVAGRIKVSEGSVGYVEYHFAKRLGLPVARLQNRAGRWVMPSESSGQVALAGNVRQMPANLRLFLPDPEGEDAYPIVTLSWLLLYERYPDPGKSAALKRFVAWSLTEGQVYSRELGYIPLPDEVVSRSLAALEGIR